MSAPLETRELRPPPLEGGGRPATITLGFRQWGRRNAAGDNTVLVCPALTGDSNLGQWWPGLLGPDRALDPQRDHIISIDVPGGSHASSGPGHLDTDGQPWGERFPMLTVRDVVSLQRNLLHELGIDRLRLVVGGSLGGMQALEWAVGQADQVDAAVVIAAAARQSAWARAWNHIQRLALASSDNLALARQIAMLSYRHWDNLNERFAPQDTDRTVASWLDHHGERLKQRFNSISYRHLTELMDSHDVGRDRGGVAQALGQCPVPALILGIESDLLYPPCDQQALAEHLPNATLRWLDAPQGHDAFLIEQRRVNALLLSFRRHLRNGQAQSLELRA